MVKKRGKSTQKTSKTSRKTSGSSSKKKTPSRPQAKAKKKAKSRPKTRTKRKKFLKIIPKPKLLEEKIQRVPHELEEEFFVPSPIHRGKYLIPLGIKFLIGYLTFLSFLYLISFIYGITFPTTILFGKMIEGTRALIINAVLLAIIFAMVFGFWRRKAYTFDLSVGFFAFTALNSIISLILFDSVEHPMFRNLLILSFISLVVMNSIIIWYILNERKYFYAERFKDRPLHHKDKVFLYVIITFWVLTLMIGGTMGYQFYKDTTRIIDNTLQELGGDYYHGILICEEKEGPEKDICELVIATALSTHQRPRYELEAICNDIQSDFYQFTCMRSIS
ncbi:hypothetical protein ACFL3V_00525 [Nanoarchaeota archaeon]